MSVCVMGTSTLTSLFKLIALLVVFILILVASYYFTKWYAKSGMLNSRSQNIQVLESYPMGPGKQISILRLGGKYVAVAISKEQITFLAELKEEDLSLERPQAEDVSFRDMFSGMIKQQQRKDK